MLTIFLLQCKQRLRALAITSLTDTWFWSNTRDFLHFFTINHLRLFFVLCPVNKRGRVPCLIGIEFMIILRDTSTLPACLSVTSLLFSCSFSFKRQLYLANLFLGRYLHFILVLRRKIRDKTIVNRIFEGAKYETRWIKIYADMTKWFR